MIRYGTNNNYWLQYDDLMDISRGARSPCQCETTTLTLRFDAARSALVIIDMQNFFLSARLGREEGGRQLIAPIITAIKCARRLGMRVVWVSWGVRDDLANLPPSLLRTFQRSRLYAGFGAELPDNLGPMLVKGSWSTRLMDELEAVREPEDIWIDKNRLSGFFGTELDQVLRAQGINSLFFAGVNTDQCVKGTLDDANCLGYDCVLLSDCTATTSPPGGYENILYNAESSGFVTTSRWLAAGTLEPALVNE